MILSKAEIVRTLIRKYRYKGNKYYCSVCGYKARVFLSMGFPARNNAMCPICGSAERHRLLWSILTKLWKNSELSIGGNMLHVAPEAMLAKKFRDKYSYLSVDMEEGVAMEVMDITQLCLEDNLFDAVVCNHVLEHIPDDQKALSELYRVMKPGGWGSFQVPIKGDFTDEDLNITDPDIRARLYGQADHVRQYGKDYIDRLKKPGFIVSVIQKESMLDAEFLRQLSVDVETDIILVRKP